MEITFQLRLPRDAATVPLVRTICRDAMTRLGVTEDCVADVALALTEACANVVTHAGGDDEYRVAVQFEPEWCHIRVIDMGPGIAGVDQRRVMPGDEEFRGRGIALMKLLVDRINFDSRPEAGTVVHLQKRLDLLGWSPLHPAAVRAGSDGRTA